MSQITELASGQITKAESLTIELIEAGKNSAITITWPAKPTIVTPAT